MGARVYFDLKPYLDRGVFRELRNVHYFNQVSILFGAVTWPNEQDIAPETLLAEMLPLEPNPPNESLQRTPLTAELYRWESTALGIILLV